MKRKIMESIKYRYRANNQENNDNNSVSLTQTHNEHACFVPL